MSNDNMVLRTIYLPPDLDDKLREIAYANRSSKNEIMRCAIETFVNETAEQQTKKLEQSKRAKNANIERAVSV